MKRSIFIIGLVLLMAGVASAQHQRTYSKIVAEGTTYTSFGNYTIKVGDQPVMLEGEKVTCYQVTYDKSPVTIEILVDEEVNCKNYIVTSEGLSVMYSCTMEQDGDCQQRVREKVVFQADGIGLIAVVDAEEAVGHFAVLPPVCRGTDTKTPEAPLCW